MSGTATFGGTLNVLLVNSFFPAAGNVFTLFTASGVSGQFVTIIGIALGNNIALDPSYTSSAFILNAAKVVGPAVISTSPGPTLTQPFSSITFTFNEAINASTFTTSQATLTGPNGAIAVAATNEIAANVFQITFTTQTTPGQYHVSLGTGVTDPVGNRLDQDQSGTPNGFSTAFNMGLIVTNAVINGDNPNGLFTAAGQARRRASNGPWWRTWFTPSTNPRRLRTPMRRSP